MPLYLIPAGIPGIAVTAVVVIGVCLIVALILDSPKAGPCDACSARAGEPCNVGCVGAAAARDDLEGIL